MATKNGSPDVEKGKPSKQSECHEFTSSESTEKEAIAKCKCTLQTWAKKIVMLPLDITIGFLAASWSTQNGNGFPSCFPYHLFLLMMMLAFYSSVTGIILWPTFPKEARGFNLVAFLFILAALTVSFASLLPSNLEDVPWICLTFVSLVIFGVSAYEECRLKYGS